MSEQSQLRPDLQRFADLLKGTSSDSTIETKEFEFKLDDISDDGAFEGYASTFGNVDSYGDIVERGAFKKTIKESKGQVPILWQHDAYEPIGVSLEMEEDDNGLHTRGQLVLEVERAAAARALMKAKALKGLSIGYSAVKFVINTDKQSEVRRHLKELKLWEYSPVTFPANTLATVGSVKSAEIVRLASLLNELRQADPELVKSLLAQAPDGGGDGADDLAGEPVKQATLRAFIDHVKQNPNGGLT